MGSEWWRTFFDEDFLPFHRDRPYQNTQEELNLLLSVLGNGGGRWLLDACCGPGRHAVPLSKYGWRVVGLDTSKVLLGIGKEKAERETTALGDPPHWVYGDLRVSPLRSSFFDAAICMWTSIGFCDSDSDHLKMIESVHDALKPDGVFILDLANRDCMIGQKGTLRNWWQRDDAYVLEETFFDPTVSVARTVNRLIASDGSVRVTEYRVRMYSLHEMVDFLYQAGFQIEKGYGGYGGQNLTLTSPRMILVARK